MPHLFKRLREVVTIKPSGIDKPAMNFVEEAGCLSRCPQCRHYVKNLVHSPDVKQQSTRGCVGWSQDTLLGPLPDGPLGQPKQFGDDPRSQRVSLGQILLDNP